MAPRSVRALAPPFRAMPVVPARRRLATPLTCGNPKYLKSVSCECIDPGGWWFIAARPSAALAYSTYGHEHASSHAARAASVDDVLAAAFSYPCPRLVGPGPGCLGFLRFPWEPVACCSRRLDQEPEWRPAKTRRISGGQRQPHPGGQSEP
jgi:hypothetical protein